MRPPLAGRRAAARRLAARVRRRLEPPVERLLALKAPRRERGAPASAVAAPRAAGMEDPAARIDAARERLRATIEPPRDPDA